MTIGEILLAVLIGLAVNECCDISPWAARKLVRWSAHRHYVPRSYAALRAEDLAAYINKCPGKLPAPRSATSPAISYLVLLPLGKPQVVVRRADARHGIDGHVMAHALLPLRYSSYKIEHMFGTELSPSPVVTPPEEFIDCLVEDPPGGLAEPVRWSEYVPDGLLADMLTQPTETAAGLPHAEWLVTRVAHPVSRWRPMIAAIPRHLFIPRWWSWSAAGSSFDSELWELCDGPADDEGWLRVAYSNQSLVTRVGPVHADHAVPGDRLAEVPTSSATLPGLVVEMLGHTRVYDGADVLDVGTGSGYGCAVLAYRQGDRQVTSVDVYRSASSTTISRTMTGGAPPGCCTRTDHG